MPTEAAEDARQLHRELLTAKRDRARVTNRVKGLLANQGLVVPRLGAFGLEIVRWQRWDGTPLPMGPQTRLGREWAKVALLTEQIHTLEAGAASRPAHRGGSGAGPGPPAGTVAGDRSE